MGEGRERKQISSTASVVMLVLIGAAVLFLGITFLRFSWYALGRDSLFLGIATLVLGIVFVAGPLVVIVSQARAMLSRRD